MKCPQLRHDRIDKSLSFCVSEVLRQIENIDIVDSMIVQRLKMKESTLVKESLDKHGVYKFMLNDLPLPSGMTPWQDIVDYKSEKDNLRRLATFRNWMNKVLKEEYSENELVDEYEAHYREFEAAIDRHKIKRSRTTLEVLLVALPDIAEDLIKVRLKNIGEKIYKGLFDARREMVSLSEAEAGAPGREIAYQFFTKEQF